MTAAHPASPIHISSVFFILINAVGLAISTGLWMWQTEWGQSSVVFFGVRVPERFEDSLEAMPISYEYYRNIKLIPLVLIAAYALLLYTNVLAWNATGAFAAMVIVQAIAVRVVFWRARNQTMPYAAPPQTTRSASIREIAAPASVAWQAGYWSAVLLPLPVLAAMAWYMWTHWLALHLPIQTNLQLPLTPDSPVITWQRAQMPSSLRWLAHGLLANTVAVLVAVAFNFRSRINEWGEEETDRRSYRRQLMVFAVIMQWIVVFNCAMLLLVQVMLIAKAQSPPDMAAVRSQMLSIMPLLLVAGLVTAVLPLWLMYQLYANRPPGFVNKAEDRHWLFGMYYFNPADSAAVVPTRFGVGESLNLGHPLAWGIVLLSAGMLGLRFLPMFQPVRVGTISTSTSASMSPAERLQQVSDRDRESFVADAVALRQGEFAASERLIYLARHSINTDLTSSVAVVLAQNHVKPTAAFQLATQAAGDAENHTRIRALAAPDELPHLALLWSNVGFVCLQQKHRDDGCASRYLAAAQSLDPHPGYAAMLAKANAADPAHAVQPMPTQVPLHLASAPAGDSTLQIVLVNMYAEIYAQGQQRAQEFAARFHAAHPTARPLQPAAFHMWAEPGVTTTDGTTVDSKTAQSVLDAVHFPWPHGASIGMRLRGQLHCAAHGDCTLSLQPESMRPN